MKTKAFEKLEEKFAEHFFYNKVPALIKEQLDNLEEEVLKLEGIYINCTFANLVGGFIARQAVSDTNLFLMCTSARALGWLFSVVAMRYLNFGYKSVKTQGKLPLYDLKLQQYCESLYKRVAAEDNYTFTAKCSTLLRAELKQVKVKIKHYGTGYAGISSWINFSILGAMLEYAKPNYFVPSSLNNFIIDSVSGLFGFCVGSFINLLNDPAEVPRPRNVKS
jgi:hypothetical protein